MSKPMATNITSTPPRTIPSHLEGGEEKVDFLPSQDAQKKWWSTSHVFKDAIGGITYSVGVPRDAVDLVLREDDDGRRYETLRGLQDVVKSIDTYESRLEETKQQCQKWVDDVTNFKSRSLRALTVLATAAVVAGLVAGIVYGSIPAIAVLATVLVIGSWAKIFNEPEKWTLFEAYFAPVLAPIYMIYEAMTIEANTKYWASHTLKCQEGSLVHDIAKAKQTSKYLKDHGDELLAYLGEMDKKMEANLATIDQEDSSLDEGTLGRIRETEKSRKQLVEMIQYLEESQELAKKFNSGEK